MEGWWLSRASVYLKVEVDLYDSPGVFLFLLPNFTPWSVGAGWAFWSISCRMDFSNGYDFCHLTLFSCYCGISPVSVYSLWAPPAATPIHALARSLTIIGFPRWIRPSVGGRLGGVSEDLSPMWFCHHHLVFVQALAPAATTTSRHKLASTACQCQTLDRLCGDKFGHPLYNGWSWHKPLRNPLSGELSFSRLTRRPAFRGRMPIFQPRERKIS